MFVNVFDTIRMISTTNSRILEANYLQKSSVFVFN